MKKKLLVLSLGIMCVMSSFNSTYASEKLTIEKYSVNTVVNGIKLDIQNFLLNGTTYVPLRAVSEILGANVSWDQETMTANIDYNEDDTSNLSNTEVIETAKINTNMDIDVQLKSSIPKNIDIIVLKDSHGNQIQAFVDIIGDKEIKITDFDEVQLNSKYYIDIIEKSGERNRIELVTDEYVNLRTGENYYRIPANPAKGFYYPYYIVTDGVNIDKLEDIMIAETNNEFITDTNYMSEKLVVKQLNGFSRNISDGKYISIMTTFPRPSQDDVLYTHSLDRSTLEIDSKYSDELGRGNLVRIDLQYKEIIEDALEQIDKNGKEMEDKVIVAGFSASGEFATRFALLHPEIVQAVISNFTTTLPLENYEGKELTYPLGVADLKELTGKEFNEESYREVKQYLFLGAEDNNDPLLYDDGWDRDDREKYLDLFGDEMQERKAKIWEVLKYNGFDKNIQFKLYENLGHGWNREVKQDILNFLNTLN